MQPDFSRSHYQGLIGASGSLLSTCIVQPLEIIKMVMIIDKNNSKLARAMNAIEHIYRTEGPKGFYRGLRPAIARNMSAGFLYFQTLSYISKAFNERTARADFASSFIARGYEIYLMRIANFITNPILVIETRAEVLGYQYTSILRTLKSIVREEGFLNLFRGGMTGTIKDSLFAGVYYLVYRKMQLSLRTEKFAPMNTFLSGMLAGLIGTAASHPFEVLRARLQTNYYVGTHSIWSSFKRIHRLEGYRGFVKGLLPRLFRKPLANSLTFLIVEQTNHLVYGLHFGH